MRNKQTGITLIELMIVVATVGILASIAYPTYRDQMIKTRRSDGHALLMQVMNAQERFFTNYGTYTTSITGAEPTGLGFTDTNSDEGYYTVSAAACGGSTISQWCSANCNSWNGSK